MPGRDLELVSVERVYFLEGIKSGLNISRVALFLGEQAEELVVLGSEFEDLINTEDDVLKVSIKEGFTLPDVAATLVLPEIAGQLGDTIFPGTEDAHTFVQLDSHVRERALPDVVFFEMAFDAAPDGLRRDAEQVLHPGLWVGRRYIGVFPDLVEHVLHVVNKRANLTQLECLNLCKGTANFREVLTDGFCFGAESLVALVGGDELALEVGPTLDLIVGAEDASELVLVEVGGE